MSVTKNLIGGVILVAVMFASTPLFAGQPKDVNVVNTPDVNVANTPNVTVTNMPDVNVANTPDVNVANVPDVIVANSAADPMPVTMIGEQNFNSNPGLPKNPLFAFKNAEGYAPILFGPYSHDTKIALGSLTFDGGATEFGTQLWLYVTTCATDQTVVLDIVGAYQVRNRAAGLGPQHMAFPVPFVLPLEDPEQDWCLQASGGSTQILITAVGYVIE